MPVFQDPFVSCPVQVSTCANGEEVYESYVLYGIPTAWRVSWHFGPGQDEIAILAITPHP